MSCAPEWSDISACFGRRALSWGMAPVSIEPSAACAPPVHQPGWAIEGAIGSEFKIDASYLSPHVNMASRLEAATKQVSLAGRLPDSLPTHVDWQCPNATTACSLVGAALSNSGPRLYCTTQALRGKP